MKEGIVMALIKCPECGKEISNKSEACIHCGFPLIYIANKKCAVNGTVYDFEEEFPVIMLPEVERYLDAMRMIGRKTGMGSSDAGRLIDIVRLYKAFPESFTTEFELKDPSAWDSPAPSTGDSPSISTVSVKCPYCQSGNTNRISGLSKAVDTALFGVFSVGRNSKNYHCNSCGADF